MMNKYEMRMQAAIIHEQANLAENIAVWAIKDAQRLHETAMKIEKVADELALEEGVVVEESAEVVQGR